MSDSFLKPDGKPDVDCLLQAFTRSVPPMQGGTQWLDQVRDCNGPGDSADGRKHADPTDPDSEAFPWENASNCKPFTADDVINELTARDLAAFWRAMVQHGMGATEEATYAVALVEHLVFGPMMASLDKEVELSAQHKSARGYCILAPRWKTKFALKRYELTVEYITAQAANNPESLPAKMLFALPDPTQDEAVKSYLREWYKIYTTSQIPKQFADRIPAIKDKQLVKIIAGLRSEKQSASVVIPYLCHNGLEISALEPWAEVVIPNEMTDVQTLLYHIEYVSKSELDGRVIGEGYSKEWVEEAKKKAGSVATGQLPVRAKLLGLSGLLGGSAGGRNASQSSPIPGNAANALVEIIHAVYLTVDEDDVPVAYCTTIHRDIKGGGNNAEGKAIPAFAKHEMVETINGELAYVALVREWRSRSITASRSVIEMVATQQKLLKDVQDQIVDRGSITIAPPVNVYESPAGVEYQFGPFVQNYVKVGKEPQFMQMPSSAGMADGVEVHNMVRKQVDNRFGLMSDDVPAPRMQILQEKDTRRFLCGWTMAFVQGLALCQQKMDDAEFARITGAPSGWLDERRNNPNLLTAVFDFDVRELDSEQFIEQVKAMNTVVIPNDVLGVIERGNYAAWMAQGIVGPRVAKRFVRPVAAASGALREQAELQVLKMYAGTPPKFLDKDDPTASGLLNFTIETVMNNPNYIRALDDEALQAVAGQQAQQIVQQMAQNGIQRTPNPLFSGLLVKWLENLKFIGITQQRNKQIGRQGVDPAPEQG